MNLFPLTFLLQPSSLPACPKLVPFVLQPSSLPACPKLVSFVLQPSSLPACSKLVPFVLQPSSLPACSKLVPFVLQPSVPPVCSPCAPRIWPTRFRTLRAVLAPGPPLPRTCQFSPATIGRYLCSSAIRISEVSDGCVAPITYISGSNSNSSSRTDIIRSIATKRWATTVCDHLG